MEYVPRVGCQRKMRQGGTWVCPVNQQLGRWGLGRAGHWRWGLAVVGGTQEGQHRWPWRSKVVVGQIGLRESGFIYLLLPFNGREGGLRAGLAWAEFPGAGGPGLGSLDTCETWCECWARWAGVLPEKLEDECGVWENKEGLRWCLGEWEGTRGGSLGHCPGESCWAEVVSCCRGSMLHPFRTFLSWALLWSRNRGISSAQSLIPP